MNDIWLLITVITIVVSNGYAFQYDGEEKVSSACAGRCSYQYSLQCPLSHKIAIDTVEHGTKPVTGECPNTPEPCQDKRQCCTYDSADCRVPFSDYNASLVYSKCSGKQECHNLRAEHIPTMSSCYGPRSESNYVAAKYRCEEDSSFVDICSNSTAYGSNLNLVLNGSQPTVNPGFKNSNLCACVVSTSDCNSNARLVISAIDVRLHQNHNITQCHPHSAFDITDGEYNSRPRSFRCATNHFYRNIDLYYTMKPYARISLYNKPEFDISQIWLKIKATYSNVDVMVTCGSAAIHQASKSVCIPPEFYPTTTPHSVQHSEFSSTLKQKTTPKNPATGKDTDPGNLGEETNHVPVIAGASSAVLIVLVLIIIACCCRRRRKLVKKRDEVFSQSLSVTAPPLPQENDYNDYNEVESYAGGNYYDPVGNGNPIVSSPFVQPVTPGKNMGSFFPTEAKKVSPPVVPVIPPSLPSSPPPYDKVVAIEAPVVAKKAPKAAKKAPVIVPKVPPIEPVKNSYDQDANPYQQPWDGKPMVFPNRKQRNDLAYATSEEIQVLIQRMDNERRRLNDGEECRSPSGFIHIDDYKLSQLKSRFEAERDDNSDEEGVNNRHSIHGLEDRHVPEHLDRHDVMCSSEDTGYRSVGSQEQILVSEDDYLVPGSAKNRKEDSSVAQRPSSQVSLKVEPPRRRSKENRSSVASEEPLLAEQYAEVCDAVDEDQEVEATTKL